MPDPERITQTQASEALQQLTLEMTGESETPKETPAAEAPAPQAEVAKPEEKETVESGQEPQAAAPESDDLESLKARLAQAEADKKELAEQAEARTRALQQRNAENERILRDKYLRKATATDKALKILKATRTEQGVAEADVERVVREIEGTMHPDSPSYAPPSVDMGAPSREDQVLTLNAFLNEKHMDETQAKKFGDWMQTEGPRVLTAREQEIAGESLSGFLHIAHTRWQQTVERNKEATRSDAAEAVRSVQRTQKEAARAAAASPNAPKKQPAAPVTSIDRRKLTKNDISTLLRKSVEQYE